MTRTTDELALLAAIRAHADEDTPRLALADYLDGLDAIRPSRKCTMCQNGVAGRLDDAPFEEWDCQSCMGTGLIYGEPDTSNRDRAALIRVQCEAERCRRGGNPQCTGGSASWCPICGDCTCADREQSMSDPGCPLHDPVNSAHAGIEGATYLDSQAATIIAANADRWRKGPACGKCHGKGALNIPDWRPPGSAYCDSCFGTGDAGGLMRELSYGDLPYPKRERVRVTYHRGMKRVHCRSVDVWAEISAQGVGKPSKWAPTRWASAVVTHHPDVCELWIEDLWPAASKNETNGAPVYCWWKEGHGPTALSASCHPPAPLWNAMLDRFTVFKVLRQQVTVQDFATVESARTVMARCAAAWARSFPLT